MNVSRFAAPSLPVNVAPDDNSTVRAVDYLARFLRDRTEKRGALTRLAEASEVSQPYLTGLLKAEKNPTLDIVDRLAAALGAEDASEVFRTCAESLQPAVTSSSQSGQSTVGSASAMTQPVTGEGDTGQADPQTGAAAVTKVGPPSNAHAALASYAFAKLTEQEAEDMLDDLPSLFRRWRHLRASRQLPAAQEGGAEGP